jgi:hypothetical protein
MSNAKPEFDQYSESYERLLNDPIRDRFSPGGTEFFHTLESETLSGIISAAARRIRVSSPIWT